MSKQEFLAQLRRGLSGLPKDDIEGCLTFYNEMLEDRMEEGLTEQEAISAMGSVPEIVAQTIADIPLAKIAKERMRPKRGLKAWEIVLIALGAPIWLSLCIAAAAVILALYASFWAVIVSLWAVFGALAVCAACGVLACAVFAAGGNVMTGLAVLSAGFVCAGLAVFAFYGCRAATRLALLLTGKITARIKNCFIKKEDA